MRANGVTAEVRQAVLRRDRVCFLARIDSDHRCADRWGHLHASDATWLLSLDHVKDGPMMGRRAPSDPQHLVAICHRSNTNVPSKQVRAAERAYLAGLYQSAVAP